MPQIRLQGREAREVKLERLVALLRADVVSDASIIGRPAVAIVRRQSVGERPRIPLLARNRGVPVHVLMGKSKFLPPAPPQTPGIGPPR